MFIDDKIYKNGLSHPILSTSYQLAKVSERHVLGSFDGEKQTYFLDLNEYLSELQVEESILYYLQSLEKNNKGSLNFIQVVKNLYYFDHCWVDQSRILSVERFHKMGRESDLTSYLGPLASIPTSWTGLGDYVLRFKGEALRFQSYIQKKVFSLRAQYWVHMTVYLPLPEFRQELDLLILLVSDPMENCNDNGMYLLLPRSL